MSLGNRLDNLHSLLNAVSTNYTCLSLNEKQNNHSHHMQYVNVFCMLCFCIHVIESAALGVQLPFILDILICMLLITLHVLFMFTDYGFSDCLVKYVTGISHSLYLIGYF